MKTSAETANSTPSQAAVSHSAALEMNTVRGTISDSVSYISISDPERLPEARL
jgi:hypothetical protein